ncbi:MAG TPA: MFS transporter [Pseudogracilibacillus sp.]|nr:MFS transporter [Pseudogracilibacillus sp.]
MVKEKNKDKTKGVDEEDVTVVDRDVAKKAVFATAMGNAMEWFDFGIYSYLVATLSKIFFAGVADEYQLILGFGTFTAAFLVRPIGGAFFGRLGDNLGRKKILAITIIMMAIGTLLIGLLPGYESIGITAPILLLVARFIQGFSTGGEYSGAMTFIAESSPDKRRGIMGSGLEVGTLTGYIGGAGLVTALTYILGDQTMQEWGWRIPFLLAAPLGIIGLYLRTNLEESPAFAEMEEKKEEAEQDDDGGVTFKDMFLYHHKSLLIAVGLVFFFNVIEYALLTYMPSHLSDVLGYGTTKGLLLVVIVMIVMIPIVLLMGHFGDRIGNKRIILGSLVFMTVLAIPAFMLIEADSNLLVFIGLMIIAISLAALQGTMPSELPALFFTQVRYGGLSITYNISVSLFGGTAPTLISWLIDVTDTTFAPAYYLMFVSIIGIVIVSLFVKKTSGFPLRGDTPTVETEKEKKEEAQKDEELWWKDEEREMEDNQSDQDDHQN